MNKIGFVEWLQKELLAKNISQAELARLSGISPPQISKIMNMQSAPSENSLSAIAHALGYPTETVFRKAGLLPPKPEKNSFLDKLVHLASQLPEDDIEELADFAETKLERLARKEQKTKPAKSTP